MLQLYAEACVYYNKETNDFDSVIDLNSYFLEFSQLYVTQVLGKLFVTLLQFCQEL